MPFMILYLGVALYDFLLSGGSVTESMLLQNTSILSYNAIRGRGIACSSSGNQIGEWYYPDGTTVREQGSGGPFYVLKRINGRIDLFPRNSLGVNDEGIYTCIIPDEDGMDQTLYIGVYSNTGEGLI